MDNAQKHNICISVSTLSNSPSLYHALSFLSELTEFTNQTMGVTWAYTAFWFIYLERRDLSMLMGDSGTL
jgi:hypothetical protein